MPYVKFLRHYTVRDDSGTQFTKGQVVEVTEASAQHFLNRGAVERVAKPKPKARTKKEAKADDGESSKPGTV